MPANVTPKYKAAEAAFRKARDPGRRLERLRKTPRTIPKHKGTDHLQAGIKGPPGCGTCSRGKLKPGHSSAQQPQACGTHETREVSLLFRVRRPPGRRVPTGATRYPATRKASPAMADPRHGPLLGDPLEPGAQEAAFLMLK